MASPSGAHTIEQEQRYWINQMRDDELAFANLYLNKATTGYTNSQCYMFTHPTVKSRQVGYRNAQRLLSSYIISKYLDAMRAEATHHTIMALDEMKEDLTVQIKGYDFLFEGVVTWEDTPEGRIAFVDNLSQVPEKLRKYINGYTYHEDSEGYELHLRSYPGRESDRNKARELLAKMQGGLIEKRDLTVRGGIISEEIKAGTSSEDAAKIYKRVMRGD